MRVRRLWSAGWTVIAGMLLAAPASMRAAGGFGSNNSVPDWVKAAAQGAPASFPGTPRVAVLLDETTYTVGTNGQAV